MTTQRVAAGPTRNGQERVVPPVPAVELGVTFTLFRRATVDDEMIADDPFLPLTDCYAAASLTEDGYRRGIAIANIHCNQPDIPNASMERIYAFVRLLRKMEGSCSNEWQHFCNHFNRFIPILHAISWCPLVRGEAFETAAFIRIASHAPLGVESGDGLRVN